MDSNDRANRIDSFSINPQIDLLKIYDESGKETATVKYGKTYKVEVLINSDGFAYPVALIAKCPNWNNAVLVGIKAAVSPPAPQISDNTVEIEFTPKASNVKDNGKFDGTITLEAVFVEKTDNTYLRFVTRRYGSILPDDLSEITSSKKELKVELEKIVVVIDPGHGHTKGRTGTIVWKYKHSIKDDNDNIKVDKDKNKIKQSSTILNIPDYVYGDLNACTKWNTELIGSDSNYSKRNEREVVFYVAELIKPELEKQGCSVYMTRTVALQEGTDNDTDLKARNTFSNSKNADYFISIHINGNDANSAIYKRGAFYMYRKTDDKNIINRSKKLGQYLLKYYKPYNKEGTDFIPVITDNIQEKDILVLSSDKTVGNRAKYKSLIEIGTYTNPKDARILASEDNDKIIYLQLVKGLFEHIKNCFE